MPPPLGKKIKGRDGRRSSSRHTTPSSTISAPLASPTPPNTAFLDIPISNLAVSPNVRYEDILERHGGIGGIPDPKHLETIAESLKMLAKLAQSRSECNDAGMRELSVRRKEALEREREREQEAREKERLETARREAQQEEEARDKASGKSKRKERSRVREDLSQDRLLNTGMHGSVRQDGSDLPVKAPSSRTSRDAQTPQKQNVDDPGSGSSSSLSEASPVLSPSATAAAPGPVPPAPLVTTRPLSSDSSSSDDARQPSKAASIPQYQTFGANPLIFDDPTVYEVKKVTDDMTDEEKREIYAVSVFPHDDLSGLIAGTPPNKDFSNAIKPNNQVQAHTFAAYLDGFLRPLKEEDIGFLKERGDRVNPFVMPRRGTKHYTEVWAEEDGGMAIDSPHDQLNPNQGRGSIEQMDDDVATTDQVSLGPVASRFLSLMRFEHRTPPSEEKAQPNGSQINGAPMNGTLNVDASFTGDDFSNFDPFAAEEAANNPVPPAPINIPNGANISGTSATNNNSKPLPSATFLPESARASNNTLNLSPAQVDDRLKQELRHLGFLGADEEPDYDAHYDDVVAQRLRFLQAKLREVSTLNGARKQRILELAEEQMAHQEYSTILEDLDSQVQTAYLKRARTAGKSKKNAKRPGGAGGGSHAVTGGMATTGGVGGMGGVSKPGIGDVARQLMNRRQRWESSIGAVFDGNVRRVRTQGESIFEEGIMKVLIEKEKEKWEEEAE